MMDGLSFLLTCPGFPFSHRKASYSVANSGALSLTSITLMATTALEIWLWFPRARKTHGRPSDIQIKGWQTERQSVRQTGIGRQRGSQSDRQV